MRFVLANPVKVSSPVCPDILRDAAEPVVFWFNVGNVQLVSVPLAGVPRTGATRVIPLAIVPATIDAAGKPVQLVNAPLVGVPRTGVTIVRLVQVPVGV